LDIYWLMGEAPRNHITLHLVFIIETSKREFIQSQNKGIVHIDSMLLLGADVHDGLTFLFVQSASFDQNIFHRYFITASIFLSICSSEYFL